MVTETKQPPWTPLHFSRARLQLAIDNVGGVDRAHRILAEYSVMVGEAIITTGSIRNWLNGTVVPSSPTLAKLKSVGIIQTIDELFMEDAHEKRSDGDSRY